MLNDVQKHILQIVADMAGENAPGAVNIRSGGYIPSVDHQTPPGVSMDNYRIYMRLLREYSEKIGQ